MSISSGRMCWPDRGGCSPGSTMQYTESRGSSTRAIGVSGSSVSVRSVYRATRNDRTRARISLSQASRPRDSASARCSSPSRRCQSLTRSARRMRRQAAGIAKCTLRARTHNVRSGGGRSYCPPNFPSAHRTAASSVRARSAPFAMIFDFSPSARRQISTRRMRG
jgi:hypothetical protein